VICNNKLTTNEFLHAMQTRNLFWSDRSYNSNAALLV
jgi:hypothetical protein